MKPYKSLLFLLPLALLTIPLHASAAVTADGAGAKKSEIGLGADLFTTKKTSDVYATFYKKAEQKRRLAKAHRRALLRKVKKFK